MLGNNKWDSNFLTYTIKCVHACVYVCVYMYVFSISIVLDKQIVCLFLSSNFSEILQGLARYCPGGLTHTHTHTHTHKHTHTYNYTHTRTHAEVDFSFQFVLTNYTSFFEVPKESLVIFGKVLFHAFTKLNQYQQFQENCNFSFKIYFGFAVQLDMILPDSSTVILTKGD